MTNKICHFNIQTSEQDQERWNPVSLGHWITILTGEQVNVERIPGQSRRFKVVLCTTEQKTRDFQTVLSSHFQLC